MLPFDRGARATEPLAALLANGLAGAKWVVELRFREDAVSAYAAAKPGGERLLVGERTGIHGTKLRGEQFGVAAPDAKCDQGSGVSYHRRSHRMRELVRVLIRQREVHGEFSRL